MNKKDVIKTNVDPVDHEEKIIKNAEDYVEHGKEKLLDQTKVVSDTMKDASKQVSAEIDRSDEGYDALKDKGC